MNKKILSVIFVLIFTFFILPSGVLAADYYVSTTGNDSSAGTQASPWRSIGRANSALQAGDTVFVRGGTYSEQIRPARTGTSSAPITYRAFSGETPIIQGGFVNLELVGVSYIVIDGFTFRDPLNNWGLIYNSNRNLIQNNRFTFTTTSAGLAQGWTGLSLGEDGGAQTASYNRVLNNTFERWGIWHPYENGGPAMAIYSRGSSYNLIEGNSFYGASHSDLRITTQYNIVRNNRFQNDQQKNLELGANTNEFGVAGYTLVEGNDFGQNEWNSEAHGGMHLHIYSDANIVRRNVFHDGAAGAMDIHVAPPEDAPSGARNDATNGASHNRFFHNVVANNGVKPFSRSNTQYWVNPAVDVIRFPGQNSPVIDNVFKNNIFFDNKTTRDFGEVQFTMNLYQWGPWAESIFAGNLVLPSTGSTTQASIYINGVGDNTPSWFNTNQPNNAYGNITGNPRFVTYNIGSVTNQLDGQYDFRLQTGSPAIDTGVNLTTTTSQGSGRVVTVVDSSYFHDGFNGMISPDVIRVGGETVTIVSINRSTDQITVDRSIVWTQGAGVNFAFNGTGPDIGAYEYGSVDATPVPTVAPSATPVPTVAATPRPTAPALPGDASGDGRVSGVDYVMVIRRYGQTTDRGPIDGDVNVDGITNADDLHIVVNGISRTPAGVTQ